MFDAAATKKWWYRFPLGALVVLILSALTVVARPAHAQLPGSTTNTSTSPSKATSPGQPDAPLDHAFLSFQPSITNFGSLATNPSSGATINTGDRFVLDLFVHAQNHTACGAQAYVSYSYDVAGIAN